MIAYIRSLLSTPMQAITLPLPRLVQSDKAHAENASIIQFTNQPTHAEEAYAFYVWQVLAHQSFLHSVCDDFLLGEWVC